MCTQTRRGAAFVLTLLVAATTVACRPGTSPEPLEIIRIGWQVPWATQGQISQTLQQTNALSLNGLTGDFKGFAAGPQLNEAALAGEVDVLFTADQPAASLLARDDRWVIVARLMANRVAVYVPPESPIRTVADLRGKTIAMPFGAAAQREALRAVREAGLDPDRDVKQMNLDIYEQNNVVLTGDGRTWGGIDAMAGFDPTPAIFEHNKVARMLHVGTVVSLVVMSRDFIEANRDAAQRFLQAYVLAYYYYARHRDQADAWFQTGSRLNFPREVLAVAASVEPNTRAAAPSDIDVRLREEHLRVMQEAADFVFGRKLAARQVTMRDHVDQSMLDAALAHLGDERDLFAAVEPVNTTPASGPP